METKYDRFSREVLIKALDGISLRNKLYNDEIHRVKNENYKLASELTVLKQSTGEIIRNLYDRISTLTTCKFTDSNYYREAMWEDFIFNEANKIIDKKMKNGYDCPFSITKTITKNDKGGKEVVVKSYGEFLVKNVS